ncbi:hypothetical protein LTR36_001352 [Oleoguttula mirabilis]|uniref:Uncharacterized protein n=1 Tax=Oleoguttula mirabilis TaxID=1507867 RepID=A0AAV9JQ83_9PEZI|nr:hypothetical protein LTR36_001352 [Oleoguttula mirabilis]
MPPKKTRAQAGSSSQPLPDTQAARATGRKRRRSDASNASDRPVVVGAKRRRGRPAATSAEPEAIEEEDPAQELSAHHQEALAMGGDATVERLVEESIDSIEVAAPRSKHVRFGSEGDAGDGTTATNLTPHPRKMAVKRRFTQSPGISTTTRIRTSVGRSSLPPAFMQEGSTEPTTIIQELQFTPLRTVLDERVRRRLRRSHLSEEQIDVETHAKRESRTQQELEELRAEATAKEQRINELALELETQRQFAIDVSDDNDNEKVQDLERELMMLRNELATHMGTHGLDDEIEMLMPDDDMLVLDSQNEVAYPHLPMTSSTQALKVSTNGEHTRTFSETKTTVRDFSSSTNGRTSLGSRHPEWEEERRQFQDAILKLHEESNDMKARMEILRIELHGLGFGNDGDSLVILDSIRQSFESIRESLETTLPDSVPQGASTQDIVEILIANVKEFADRLRSQDEELHEKGTLIADLSSQIQGLLDHLADAEIRKASLEQQWTELDQGNESKAREIEDLEEELETAREERDDLAAKLAEKQAEARALGVDHGESIKSLEKLTVSLENYRLEETRLTALITRMEQDHRTQIVKMNTTYEGAVRELEDRLDTEIVLRGEAETLADERQTEISRLEIELEAVSTQRDELSQELENTKAERDAIVQERDTADAELEQKTVQIEDLETRVDRFEEELEALNTEVVELRRLNETERRQREAAEQDLDDRNVEIDQLNQNLHDQGKEANELRLKLFEVQQQNALKVKDLEQQMSERDEEYQTDIAAEVIRRQDADELAQQRAVVILELENRIVEIELLMRNDIADRDERIATLEAELVERDGEIEGLRLDLQSVENTLDLEKTNYEDRTEELTGSVLALQETIVQREATIQRMQIEAIRTAELHNSEMEDRNAEIADLHATVTMLQTEKADLELQVAGLERRVEQEAEAMLDLQNNTQDEIESYKATIREKQAKILIVEEKAIEADKRWQEVLAARDEQVASYESSTVTYEERVDLLAGSYQALMTKFKDYVAQTSAVMVKLQAAVTTAKVVTDDEGDMLKAAGDAMLGELESTDVVGQMSVTRTSTTKTTTQTQGGASSSQQIGSARKGVRGRKTRRVHDSAIGIHDGEAEEELA